MLRASLLTIGLLASAATASAQDTTPEQTPTPTPLTGATTDWDICNETSFILRFAAAYVRSDRMQAVGWTSVQPGVCERVKTPRSSPRFLYAESADIHRGGIREWKGEIELCAAETDFVSDATDNCQLKNLGTRDYFAVKPTERRTAFIEPSDFGDKADIAGVQRLLRDAGYAITRVDGLSGRRTARTIATAKSDLGLESDATSQDLMAALIAPAETARADVGLNICNDSTENVFAAIAIQANGTWTSRGWWAVAPDSCTKPYDESLIGTQAHVFALQAAKNADGTPAPDRRLQAGTATPSQYCIAESKFSALGQENCADKGYAAASFRPVPTDVDGQVMRLTDADFAAPSPDGLRR